MISLRAWLVRFLMRHLMRPLFWRGEPADLRRRMKRLPPPPRGVALEPAGGGVPAAWLRAPPLRDDERRVLCYIHGGAFIIGAPSTHWDLGLRLAEAVDARPLLFDYRLAPEHPFPAAVEDCLAAYRHLLARGVRPRDILVAGDSAGGNLMLAMLLALRDAGDPLPAAAVALSPVTDLTLSGASYRTRAGDEAILTRPIMERAVDWYLPSGIDRRDPQVSPLFAELRGLPPLLVHVGTHELLLDDSLRLAERARAAGVDVTLKVWDAMFHVFHGVTFLPEARRAHAEIAEFARRHLPPMANAKRNA
jgi:acetyl esterase/lipase